MKPKDKRVVQRIRKERPDICTGKTNKEVLNLVKNIFDNDRKKLNKGLDDFVKSA